MSDMTFTEQQMAEISDLRSRLVRMNRELEAANKRALESSAMANIMALRFKDVQAALVDRDKPCQWHAKREITPDGMVVIYRPSCSRLHGDHEFFTAMEGPLTKFCPNCGHPTIEVDCDD